MPLVSVSPKGLQTGKKNYCVFGYRYCIPKGGVGQTRIHPGLLYSKKWVADREKLLCLSLFPKGGYSWTDQVTPWANVFLKGKELLRPWLLYSCKGLWLDCRVTPLANAFLKELQTGKVLLHPWSQYSREGLLLDRLCYALGLCIPKGVADWEKELLHPWLLYSQRWGYSWKDQVTPWANVLLKGLQTEKDLPHPWLLYSKRRLQLYRPGYVLG
jgi:hypothetical protein